MWAKTITSWGRILGLGGSEAAEAERRLWGRVPCDLETIIQPANGDPEPSLPARARNVSAGGINLTAAKPFEPGTLLSVALPIGGGTEVLACVVRCEAIGADQWGLGCTFAAQLSEEDLQTLGARKEKAGPQDQRAWVRYPCNAWAAYQVVRAGGESAGTAAVLDVSASGIAMRAETQLHVGELLSLELRCDGATLVTTLASVVRTATDPGGARVVGCNFIRELPDEQVSALLQV